ncbi:MAG: DHA2 family efflux MFS transporter permease subunit [Acidimicrobiales bacterium]
MNESGTGQGTVTDAISPDSWRTLSITSLVGFMVSMEITVIALALPEIRDAFPDAAESTLSWIITAYNIGLASLLLVAGWAADRFGRKRVFLIGLGLFTLGSLAAGFAPGIETLIAARIFQSFGGAMQFPAGLALLLNAFPPARRQMAIGIWGAMGGLAAAVGPPLGGFLVSAFGWRSVFLINVPVSTGALLLGIGWLSESRNESSPSRVDLVSIPVGTIGVGAMVLGIVRGSDWGWAGANTIGTFALGGALVAIFVFRSSRHPSPLFDLGLFRTRSFTLGNLGSIFFVIAFFAYFVPLPTYIQEVWGWSALKTGLLVVPSPLVAAVLSPLSGRLADRIGAAPILTVGGIAGVMAMGLHLWLTDTDAIAWTMIVPGLMLGIAAGCSFAMLVGATMQDIPSDRFGMAGAGRTTVFQLGLAVSIAVAVAIVGRPVSASDHLSVIRVLWLVSLGCFAAQAIVFGVLFPKRAPGSQRT